MKDILIFTTRQLCYNSGNFFAKRIGKELELSGYNCVYCEIPENAIPASNSEIAQPASINSGKYVNCEAEDLLERHINKKYIAVIDFNSKLPRLIMDDNSYYLDNINAPFFNILLDHPLYHHNSLECRLNNYNVMAIDEDHCSYIRKNYPDIKNVYNINLGADACKSYENNKEEYVLFMGTYRNPDFYYNQILSAPEADKKIMLGMLDELLDNSEMTIEKSLKIENNPLNYNKYYLVEMFYRNYYRKKVIDSVVSNGFPVKVIGEWWNQYDKIGQKNIVMNSSVSYEESYEVISRHKILLDSSPFFKKGIHDRVYSGMANRTAVLSDYSEYKKNLLQGEIETYKPECLKDEICEKIEKLMKDECYYTELTEKAYTHYCNEYTWRKSVDRIIKHFLCE